MTEKKELKRLDFNTGEFTANGTIYRIEGALTIERYAELQILEKEMGYATSFKGIYEKMQKAYDLLNKQKFADAAVCINDIMRGVAKAHEREPTILKICTLFINTENEDRTKLDKDVNEKKITDWKREGIDMRDFFLVASNSVNGFLEIYRNATRNISEKAQ
jgi:hypothetical protein